MDEYKKRMSLKKKVEKLEILRSPEVVRKKSKDEEILNDINGLVCNSD